MNDFDPLKITRQIATYYDQMFEMDTKDIQIKPDFYSFYEGKFVCGKCGEKYRLFHFIHRNKN